MANKTQVAQAIVDAFPLIGRMLDTKMRKTRWQFSPAHMAVLKLLALQPLPQSELTKRLQVSAPTMSATVEALVKRRWLKRQITTEDRRAVRVEITAQGQAALAELDAQLLAEIKTVLAPLTEAELDAVLAGSQILRRAFLAAFIRETGENFPRPSPPGQA